MRWRGLSQHERGGRIIRDEHGDSRCESDEQETTETEDTEGDVGLVGYHPEMGETKPEAQIEASIGHYGGWFVKSAIELKGRGITFLGTIEAMPSIVQPQNHIGWHNYKVTDLAFEKICKAHRVSHEMLLS